MAALIGTRHNAQRAVDIVNGVLNRGRDWEYLTGGSIRSVLLHKPTNVVYKVEADEPWAEGYNNADEIRNARALRRKSWVHVRIPATSGFTIDGRTVVAMEYVEGDLGRDVERTHNKPARQEIFDKGKLHDLHGDNFKFEHSTGKLVPIDLGCPRGPSNFDSEPDRRVLSCGDGSVWE